MITYLVFKIVYCTVFWGIPLKGNGDIDNVQVQFWYLMLWRHKELFNFCIIQDIFLKEFRHVLIRAKPKKITQEVYFAFGLLNSTVYLISLILWVLCAFACFESGHNGFCHELLCV